MKANLERIRVNNEKLLKASVDQEKIIKIITKKPNKKISRQTSNVGYREESHRRKYQESVDESDPFKLEDKEGNEHSATKMLLIVPNQAKKQKVEL